jgi:hypothetical protein
MFIRHLLRKVNEETTLAKISNATLTTSKPNLCTQHKECNIKPKYTKNELISIQKIGQLKIREELNLHMHASTRTINKNGKKRLANTDEQKKELLDHYDHFHSEEI